MAVATLLAALCCLGVAVVAVGPQGPRILATMSMAAPASSGVVSVARDALPVPAIASERGVMIETRVVALAAVLARLNLPPPVA